MRQALRFTFILLAFSFLFFSCVKETYHKLSDREKLEGVWVFDKVKHRKSGNLSRKEITDNFRLSSIKFNLDGSFSYYNHPNELIEYGIWEIVTYYEFDEEDDEEEINDLYLDFLDTNNYLIETWFWPSFSLRKNKICAEEQKVDGKYWYDLIRAQKK